MCNVEINCGRRCRTTRCFTSLTFIILGRLAFLFGSVHNDTINTISMSVCYVFKDVVIVFVLLRVKGYQGGRYCDGINVDY